MNYADFIRRQTDISVADAIEILTPIFLRAIQWNPDGDISKIKAEKAQFIEHTIVQFVNNKGINGNLVYYNEVDNNGFPIVDDEEYVSQKLSRTRSIVDCKQLLSLFHYNFKKDYIVPPELEELLNIKSFGPSPEKKPDSITSSDNPLDEEVPQNIREMPETILRKKVAELSNEKDKWDKSITTAAKIGLLFYEKELPIPTTEDAFVSDFIKEFSGLPKKTISMIYKSLPAKYRNKGGSPPKESVGIDDDTLDLIIETAVASGLIIGDEEVKDAKELEKQLARLEFDVPPEEYLRVISGACKRVLKKYDQAIA
ncbi:MAG: hypothetical protein A2X82_11615 [Geobacteraceae bacterium GWC2_55_20]|nr:MAG: hypothetical protein A2X82_11615 [Geobacteraceae bacterium GWC2_55_20]OGU23357.1 MAG: hypothetical protein A2X85_17800 [Geobacteraceae bacterium GWF2_54_21]HCE66861.1 hypothetical protein [Geobacter sp.]